MTRRKTLLIIGAFAFLALAVAVGTFLWSALSNHPGQIIKLSNGTSVMFYRATYGTNYQVAYGTGWRDQLARYIPLRYASNFNLTTVEVPARTISSLSGTPNPEMLIIWMKMFRPPAAPAPSPSAPASRARPVASSPSVRLTVLDDSGFESVAVMVAGGNGTLQPFAVPNFPRRKHGIRVRVRELIGFPFNPGSQPTVGEFEMPNPARRNGPVWTADPLPQTRTTNSLEISLVKLETGHSFGDFVTTAAPTAILGTYSAATFDLKENGQPTSDWAVRNVQAVSPANRAAQRQNVIMARSTPGSELCPFGIALWPEDPVWDLTVEAVRTTNFPPEEMWTIPGIPVPKPYQTSPLSAVTNLDGARFSLVEVGHTNVVVRTATSTATVGSQWSSSLSSSQTANTTLGVELTNCPPGLHFSLLSVTTDQGEQIKPTSSTTTFTSTPDSGPGSSRTWLFTFKLPDDCQTFTPTFLIDQSRFLTFRAHPEIIK